MTDPNLFPELEPVAVPAAQPLKLSAGARRTLRQYDDIARGRHPLTRGRIHADPERTCGDCVHRVMVDVGNKRVPKCHWEPPELASHPFDTASEATDVRAFWPGCVNHAQRRTA